MSVHTLTMHSMLTMHAATEAVFWLCAAGVIYAYGGYPLVIWALSRCFGRLREPTPLPDEALPSVTLLISAYNEEAVIAGRVENALALDYPSDRLRIVIGSDCSSDRTCDIVQRYAARGVSLVDFGKRSGKAAVLNSIAQQSDSELLFFSDANTQMDPQSLRRLVRWFQDERVGAASGKLVLQDAATGRNLDGIYWRYETFLKICEGRLGAPLGANGAIYLLRRELYTPIPPTSIDDLLIPLLAKLRSGCQIVFDPTATAYEETAPDISAEFRRRARFGASGFESMKLLWRLLNPMRGWIAFTFLSHKVLRWVCPFLLLLALLTNALLWRSYSYRCLLAGQLLFYGLAAISLRFSSPRWYVKPLRLAGLFVGMNLALLIGFVRWLRGPQSGVWSHSRQVPVAPLGSPPPPVNGGQPSSQTI